ncbi:hypothetical protein ATZ33_11975 [Enterococcus silesiacus]|uniref:Radical SAM core domain-containing protein n=1 Tax=Enterococcus silesiacus TaxID=332949 RepID=A0A0S3KCM9_9ENTE|nr:radical SAM protein [Enterococcus silesiacus]ALS02074.1 hypothetical protein ATZ33_11975 [Enterococcus silesiacus]OJG91561.1 hypothetical protein RV15_GL000647 [Enterococcus silesiacus]
MYLSLKEGNYLLNQPTGISFSYILNGTYMNIGVNKSAEDILLRLSGQYEQEMIVAELCEVYNEKHDVVKGFVNEFINTLKSNNVIVESNEIKNNIVLRGSETYYTPEHVTFELTHKCPLSCQHCFVDAGFGSEMDSLKCKESLQELLDMGVSVFQLTGGEPFVYSKVDKIIEMIHREGRAIHITTSGYIYTKTVQSCLDLLSESDTSQIQVSVDGLEATHNQIRGKKDSYDKAIKFIKGCVKRGINTSVATSLIKQPIEEIEKLASIVKALGVTEYKLGLITNQGRAKDNKLNGYTYNEYCSIVNYLKKNFDDEFFTIEEIEEKSEIGNCGAGYKTLKIKPNMMVTPCAMMQLNIGNLKHEQLKTILNRSFKLFSKLEFPDSKQCSTCSEENYCKGCISEAIIRKDSVSICNWEVKQQGILCEII